GGGYRVGFAARLQQAPQQVHHGRDIERLADKIAGPAGHRFHRHLQRTLRRHQHDGQIRVHRAQRIHQFQPAQIRHVDIAQHGIELAGFGGLQRLAPVARAGHAETVECQAGFEHQRQAEPGAWHIRVRHARNAVNLSNTRPRSASGMPYPWSATSMATYSSSARAERVTAVPSALYLMALETRFSTARESRSASARNGGRSAGTLRTRRIWRCAATGSSRISIRSKRLSARTGESRISVAPLSSRVMSRYPVIMRVRRFTSSL